MPVEHRFTLPLPNGLHARPASHLAEKAGAFAAAITFVNERTGRSANAKSVLALVGTESREGDPCRLRFEGADEAAACALLAPFVGAPLAHCDLPLEPQQASAPQSPDSLALPRVLRAAGLGQHHTGRIVCGGIAKGALVFLEHAKPVPKPRDPGSSPVSEFARFHAAGATLRAYYQRLAAATHGPAAAVLQAHLLLLGDPLLVDGVKEAIGQGASASEAVAATMAAHAAALAASESAYLRERVADLEDIETRLLEHLDGTGSRPEQPLLEQPTIVVAEHLTPSQLLSLDRRHVSGLALGRVGFTSHTAILARSFGIPTLIDVSGLRGACRSGTPAVLDAVLGIAIPEPSAGVLRLYEREKALLERQTRRLAERLRGQAAATRDGHRLEIGANIVSPREASLAFEAGAEGIGLFRTELLFADRATAPSEDEQAALYEEVVQAAGGRPVVIRTLDVGGDKPMPFLPLPAEPNPFLGWRGMRLYDEHRTLIDAQLRALLRAAAQGPLGILVPMVASVEEARTMRRHFEMLRAQAACEGWSGVDAVRLGFMLEVPSVAFAMEAFCREADFLSLGTNDLAQYFFAADRGNAKVSDRYDPLHPAFLRLLRQLVDAARAQGRWIGLCGHLAENPDALPALVGLGLDEISVPPSVVARVRTALARLDSRACAESLNCALRCDTAEEARKALGASRATPKEAESMQAKRDIAKTPAVGDAAAENALAATAAPLSPVGAEPLITPDLVIDDLDCDTKEEAIHAMIAALRLAGRTNAPVEVEEVVWRREETYSTGFGDGFAMPHGRTDCVSENSIVLARLRRPIAWQSLDDLPVDVVVLLLIRESGDTRAHLRCLSRLSRLLMHDAFRERLRQERDPAALSAHLLDEIQREGGAEA